MRVLRRPTQREWLQLVGGGRLGVAGALLHDACGFLIGEEGSGAERARAHAPGAESREAVLGMAKRMAGRVSHIGRTRHLASWDFPPAVAKAGEAVALPPRILQCVFIGDWRNLGAKWYGEREVAMRETAEWRGSKMTKLVWETLADSHPQARPVWERLSLKRKRAKQAAAAAARKPSGGGGGAAASRRPVWSDAIGPPKPKPKGIKSAKDKEPDPRPKDLGIRGVFHPI